MLKSTRSTLSRGGYRIFQKREGLDPRCSGVEREREGGGGGGQSGHMSPGAGLWGRRNRREIINYRVNENSRAHGQIQGTVVNPFI